MAWIESHQSLSRHRKTLRAAAILRVDRHKLIGHLHELWWWALDNVDIDGSLGDMSDHEIAAGAQWDGNPEEFVIALTEGEFITATNDGRCLHDWYDYAGKLMERRVANRERMKQARATHVQRTSLARAGATVPNRTKQNQKDLKPLATADAAAASEPGSATPRKNPAKQQIDRAFHERFWPAYPRKVAKQAALTKWRSIKPAPELVDTILAALARQRASPQWQKDGGQFIPHPATWLSQRRWEDEAQPRTPQHSVSDFDDIPEGTGRVVNLRAELDARNGGGRGG